MEAAYAAAGVDRFAAWVHETDGALRADLEARGYTLDTTTRAMGMALDDLRGAPPELELDAAGVARLRRLARERRRAAGVAGRRRPARVPPADRARTRLATALAFDFGDDCGIYNVGTLEHARRRGLGTALTARLLHDARARGRRTASLQATADGRAPLRRARLPRPRPHPRVRP